MNEVEQIEFARHGRRLAAGDEIEDIIDRVFGLPSRRGASGKRLNRWSRSLDQVMQLVAKTDLGASLSIDVHDIGTRQQGTRVTVEDGENRWFCEGEAAEPALAVCHALLQFAEEGWATLVSAVEGS